MSKTGSLIYYYHLLSQPSRVLKILLDVNKVPHTPKVINLLRGEHRKEEFKSINKFQRVPVINHNDFVLTESVAIARYLCRELSIPDYWYPQESIAQAKVDEFLEWQHIDLRHFCLSYFAFKFFRPLVFGKLPKDGQVEFAKLMMEKACNNMENVWLQDTPYVCGNHITIADLFGACELEQPRMAGYEPREGRPRLEAWMARVENDLKPFYTDAHKFVRDIAIKHKGVYPSSISEL